MTTTTGSIIKMVFSPTGGTRRVADIVGGRLGAQLGVPVTNMDLSDPKAAPAHCRITPQDTAVIAMPCFGGRVPAAAAERLRQTAGSGARCILICVYGNRAFEDALAEMEDIARGCGFTVIAGIAAVAVHSILPQYGAGRPDAADEQQLTAFADRIAQRTQAAAGIPGNRPYKKAGGTVLVPRADSRCTSCGACAAGCPVQAIDPASLTADHRHCIGCMRCVRQCPAGARQVSRVMVSAAALALKKACADRKENTLYL